MITCYNCGKQVSDDTLICPECGALVRRYESPPQQQEPQENFPPLNPVVPTPQGAFRYSTGVKVWFSLCLAFFGVYAFSFLLSGIMLLSDSSVADMLLQIYKEAGVDLVALYGSTGALAKQMLINGGGCLIETVLLIVLLASKRRRFLAVLLIASVVLVIISFFTVGIGALSLYYLVCAAVTYLLLKKNLQNMKR